jgi:hypothetical protein
MFPFTSFLVFLAFVFLAFVTIAAVLTVNESIRVHKLNRTSGAFKLGLTRNAFERARAELSAWVWARVNDKGLKFAVSRFAPDTFERLVNECSETRMLVADTRNPFSFFGDRLTALAFQAWHDSEHIRTGFDFSESGEAKLTAEHMKTAKATGLGSEARAILKAAVITRVRYYFKHGRMPHNQAGFAWLAFAYGPDAALGSPSL